MSDETPRIRRKHVPMQVIEVSKGAHSTANMVPKTIDGVASDYPEKTKRKRYVPTGRPPGRPKKGTMPTVTPMQARYPTMARLRVPASAAKHSSNRSRDDNALERENPLVPTSLAIPPEPTYDPAKSKIDAMLYEDQQIARVEAMMLKGVRSPRVLAAALGVPEVRTIERWMVRVNARWEVSGKGSRLVRYRGEAFARIDMFRNELSIAMANLRPTMIDGKPSGDARAFIVCVQQLKDLERLEMEFRGMSPNAVERLNATASDDNEVLARMSQQEQIATFAKRFAALTGLAGAAKASLPAGAKTPTDDAASPGDDGSDRSAFEDLPEC